MNNHDSKIPSKYVVSLAEMTGDDEEDIQLLREMAEGAQNYLKCFPWCKSIREAYFGDGYGGIVAVFLIRIEPSKADVDEWLWVVFGDVPPAYLVTDLLEKPSQVLLGYMEELSKWVQLAKEGRSSPDVIPVYVPATPENAANLEIRLKILSDDIIPAFQMKENQQV
jgi:hypothetical protein